MKTTSKTPLFNPNLYLPVAADVSKDKSNYACEVGDELKETEATNARKDIQGTLSQYREIARARGMEDAVLILEPTAGYERQLVRVAREMGVQVFYANTEAVKKLQVLQDGTSSKSDRKDPRTILTVAKVGHLMKCRDLGGRWQALRQMNVHHGRLETELTRLKGRARRLLDELFPRLDFSNQWFFDAAAVKIAKLYRFDPYAMREDGFGKAARRMRKEGLRPCTIVRVVDQAMVAVEVGLDPFYRQSLALELGEVYGCIERAAEAKAWLEARFESVYDELLESREARIRPVAQVLPKVRLAMIHGETGPLDDFQRVGQLRKYAGMNLRLKESGKSSGRRKISKKGRPMLRKILTQTCLPLVREGELYGDEYHARKAAGAPGKKAMMAVASKQLKMIFGLHRSGAAFDRDRVFSCQNQYHAKAA